MSAQGKFALIVFSITTIASLMALDVRLTSLEHECVRVQPTMDIGPNLEPLK